MRKLYKMLVAIIMFAVSALMISGISSITVHVYAESGLNTGTPVISWYMNQGGVSAESYEIANEDELAGLALLVNDGTRFNGTTITLKNNLDLSVYKNYNENKGWISIGTLSNPFGGIFDGNGKTISNLFMHDEGGTAFAGLFGCITACTIKNLSIVDADIFAYYENDSGNGSTAGIAARALENSTVENCFVSGSIKGKYSVGALIGNCWDEVIIRNCFTMADIEGYEYIGGVAGVLSGVQSFIENCYATGTVKCNYRGIGGIAGEFLGGMVKNCVALQSEIIIGDSWEWLSGRISGHIHPDYAVLKSNYALNTMKDKNGTTAWENKTIDNKDGADVTMAAASVKAFWETAANWDGDVGWDNDVWYIIDGKLPELMLIKTTPASSEIIAAARDLVQKTNYTIPQTSASTSAQAKNATNSILIALFNEQGFIGMTYEILNEEYIAPQKGTAQNPVGVNGSFSFDLEFSIGTVNETLSGITFEIIAKEYGGGNDFPWGVVGGISGGVVLIGGGFAIWWFLIRKKKTV